MAIRPGLDVGDDPEVRAEDDRRLLGEVVVAGDVIGDAVLERRIADADLLAVPGEVEAEQGSMARIEVPAIFRNALRSIGAFTRPPPVSTWLPYCKTGGGRTLFPKNSSFGPGRLKSRPSQRSEGRGLLDRLQALQGKIASTLRRVATQPNSAWDDDQRRRGLSSRP